MTYPPLRDRSVDAHGIPIEDDSDYDGQGKSMSQEAHDTLRMLGMLLLAIGIAFLGILGVTWYVLR